MSHSLIVEGPIGELTDLREEVRAKFSDQVIVSGLREMDEDILSPGRMGDSPIVSFIIEFASDVSAAGAVAAIKTYISIRNNKVKVKESSTSVETTKEVANPDE